MTGKDIILTLTDSSSQVLASTAVKSQDIKTHCDAIEKSSETQQTWREFTAGRKDWSLTVTYLLLTAAKVKDLLMVGQTFGVVVQKINDNTNKVTGTAILTDVQQTSTVGNLATGSFTFQGSGPLV
jgi:predicted secreted protein